MNRQIIAGLIVATGVALGGGFYYWQQQAAKPAPAPLATGPHIENPLGPAAAVPLPTLADSDDSFGTELATLFHAEAMPELFYPTRLARRFVATVDNLPREQVAATVRLMRPPEGALAVRGEEPSLSLAPENSGRYAKYLELLASADSHQAVSIYRKFYPLLQQAYDELGYPGHYFNDRVVEVIDHLLATPEAADPVPLIHPSVMFKFADPRVEKLSAGQKAMIRIGRDNALAVKAKLREIRAQIATQPAA